jgi:hypothetical protein
LSEAGALERGAGLLIHCAGSLGPVAVALIKETEDGDEDLSLGPRADLQESSREFRQLGLARTDDKERQAGPGSVY